MPFYFLFKTILGNILWCRIKRISKKKTFFFSLGRNKLWSERIRKILRKTHVYVTGNSKTEKNKIKIYYF